MVNQAQISLKSCFSFGSAAKNTWEPSVWNFFFISDLSVFAFTACPRLLIAMLCKLREFDMLCTCTSKGPHCTQANSESFPLVTLYTGCKERSRFCVKPQECDLIFLTSSALGSSVLWGSFARKPPAYLVRVLPTAAALVCAGRGSRQGCAPTGQVLHGCLLAGISRCLNINWLCPCSCSLKQDTKCNIVSPRIKNTCTVFLM